MIVEATPTLGPFPPTGHLGLACIHENIGSVLREYQHFSREFKWYYPDFISRSNGRIQTPYAVLAYYAKSAR